MNTSLKNARRRAVPLAAMLAVAALVAACATPGTNAPQVADAAPPVDAPVKPEAKRQIAFVDLDSFDKQMEQALASGADVEVVLNAPMSPNAIAPRLGKWLNTVQEYGGDVAIKNESRTRSLSLITGLMDVVYTAWKGMQYRALVKDVKAEIEISQNEIKRISFKRGAAPAA